MRNSLSLNKSNNRIKISDVNVNCPPKAALTENVVPKKQFPQISVEIPETLLPEYIVLWIIPKDSGIILEEEIKTKCNISGKYAICKDISKIETAIISSQEDPIIAIVCENKTVKSYDQIKHYLEHNINIEMIIVFNKEAIDKSPDAE